MSRQINVGDVPSDDTVADGLSNPQIAASLHLSRHTVESHLKRIYTKLGVSRVELATLVSRGPSG